MRELPSDITLPPGLLQRDPPDPPATPRDAATVVLLRDTPAVTGSDGDGSAGIDLEVFLLRRVAGMAFAGGMTVFPGGGVDTRDAEVLPRWAGPDPRWWAGAFDCTEQLARALVCAAVREMFEESGVLLAGPEPTAVVADTQRYADARRALVARELSLAQFLRETDLVLRSDLLRPWANWVTPEAEPRRYDTRFFVAELPQGQRADGETSEADAAGWCRPGQALDEWKQGSRGLLPPTWTTLTELEECGSVREAMTVTRRFGKVIPKVIRDGETLRLVLPGSPEYERASGHLDARPGDRLER